MIWGIIFILIIGSWIGAFILNSKEKKRSDRFSKFLAENAESLMNGSSLVFEGDTYRYDTALVQYQFAVSLISVSMTRGTSLRPKKDKVKMLLICTFISLFGGWWGIPWGPYYTIVSFINNGKAKEVTIQQLILSVMKQN